MYYFCRETNSELSSVIRPETLDEDELRMELLSSLSFCGKKLRKTELSSVLHPDLTPA